VAAACSSTPAASAPPSAAATAAPTAAAQTALARVKDKGIYVAIVGEKPWAFIDTDGSFKGAEAEMVQECATKLGIPAVLPVSQVFDGLLPGLQARRYDMIAAGMSIKPARLEVAISTQLLYRYGTRIIGKKGDTILPTLTSWTAVGKSGIEVAGIRGSTEITDTAKFGVKWKEYPDNPSELADLLAGRIRLMAWNDNYYGELIAQKPDTPIESVKTWDYEGIVSLPGHYFNPADTDLRDAFNNCYSDMKTNGDMAKILTKWGFDPSTIPPPGPGFPPGAPS